MNSENAYSKVIPIPFEIFWTGVLIFGPFSLLITDHFHIMET